MWSRIAAIGGGVLGLLVLTSGGAAQEGGGTGPANPPKQPTESREMVTIRVVDESGAAAPGVAIGGLLFRSMAEHQSGERELGFYGETKGESIVTDREGKAQIDAKLVFYQGGRDRPMPVIAWDKEGGTIGLGKVEQKDIGGTVDVTVFPACRVTARLRSTGLERLRRTLVWANVYVYWGTMRPMGVDANDGVHEFLLPPGEYKLYAYGSDTDTEQPLVKVERGQKELTVEVDLPASRLAELTGNAAPELSHIKGWRNGGPTTLGELKGKVVLLDFWGYWCGPCVHSMPELMELHEKYKDRGLVIIAVHDDSVADIAEMDAKLTRVRADVWEGKDLPFLVALDGGGEVAIEGHKGTASGATTAAYGIRSFPTAILIGRDGKVIGRLTKGNERTERVERALAEEPPAR